MTDRKTEDEEPKLEEEKIRDLDVEEEQAEDVKGGGLDFGGRRSGVGGGSGESG
jgi:hypothetical protein